MSRFGGECGTERSIAGLIRTTISYQPSRQSKKFYNEAQRMITEAVNADMCLKMRAERVTLYRARTRSAVPDVEVDAGNTQP